MRRCGIVVLVSMFVAIAWSESAALEPGRDGWQTWRVEALGEDFDGCCYSGKRVGCNLDRGNLRFVGGEDCAAASGHVQVYALMRGGTPERIHVLSSACPVEIGTGVRDLGDATVEATLRWLRDVATSPHERGARDHAIFVLSELPADAGVGSLVVLLESRDLDSDVREQALFWLASSGSDKAYSYLDELLSDD